MSREITIKGSLAEYQKRRAQGYRVVWVGEGLIHMVKQ